MVAKVQQFPTPALATQSFTVIFNPDATSPEDQFTFDTPTGGPFLFIDEDTTISVTLEGGDAVFSSTPITWALSPPHAPVPPGLTNQISFSMPEPAHYFCPWVFRLNVNAAGVNGILTPNFFLVKSPAAENATSATLSYSSTDGTFSLEPAAVVLASEMIMINTIAPFTITINLDVSTGVTFNAITPILWPGGTPSWIEQNSSTDTELVFTISQSPGQLASFQFALDVPSGSSTLTVLSPDPILINATIGDGG